MSQPVLWQRIEGATMVAVSLVIYTGIGADWWLFAFLLAPDLSIAGYLLGSRSGQTIYNMAHTYAFPLLFAIGGYWISNDLLLALSLIWVAHIGIDRTLGYGLKEQAGFTYTHLGRVGAARPSEAALALEN